jgi:hypothetical protein
MSLIDAVGNLLSQRRFVLHPSPCVEPNRSCIMHCVPEDSPLPPLLQLLLRVLRPLPLQAAAPL